MDGFHQTKGIVVIAATNRIDIIMMPYYVQEDLTAK
ncbi:hypothetical protein ['Chrysanthemum coronarium' phytoplasma]|nr:hypothetical protein ['Chrysanthemum coronarium' phytoplasma]